MCLTFWQLLMTFLEDVLCSKGGNNYRFGLETEVFDGNAVVALVAFGCLLSL